MRAFRYFIHVVGGAVKSQIFPPIDLLKSIEGIPCRLPVDSQQNSRIGVSIIVPNHLGKHLKSDKPVTNDR